MQVAMMGAESYGKFNRFLWIGQLVTIWLTLGCMLFRKPGTVPSHFPPHFQVLAHGGIFTGPRVSTFRSNLFPPYPPFFPPT